ncbi:MAG: class III poly(R)-hydroxyalkanoic acid synthase subunit PhaE [Gammaproteobacteria bacterium]|jgi:polyhydroxyalkanoate synthase subunit PhaE|nr:class III poly(R)-hydroxyalkanoic acid synthase subunit PhaE [Gammaproteobacteria bacterium]
MNTPWDTDWLEAQKKYMEALTSFGSVDSSNKTTGMPDSEWQKALDYWWQTSSSAMPEDAQAIFSNLLQHSKSWYSITEQFDDLLQAISSRDNTSSDWRATLEEHIKKMKMHVESGFAGADKGFWQNASHSPVDNWQKMFNSIFSNQDTTSAQYAELQANIEKFSSLSGLGPNKQIQEQMQQGLHLWQDYQKHYQAYRETIDNIASNSLDKLQEKIIASAKQEKSISSLRDLYDLWVDSHEEAYSDLVLTEDYSRLYGQLINSLLAFKAHNQQFLSDASKALNIPTADTQDTLQQELVDIKQQQKQDKERIKILEEKINQLDNKSSSKIDSLSVNKKKVSKKKVQKKKRVARKTTSRSENIKK